MSKQSQMDFLDGLSSSFPKIALTEDNENRVRNFLFHWWKKRWIRLRKKYRQELNDPKTPKKRLDYIKGRRQLKSKSPRDLSGACKVASQFSYIVFDIPGMIFTNKRHAFIWKDDGSIYDLNRYCEDVSSMKTQGKDPYELDKEKNDSPDAQKGMASWNKELTKLVRLFEREIGDSV